MNEEQEAAFFRLPKDEHKAVKVFCAEHSIRWGMFWRRAAKFLMQEVGREQLTFDLKTRQKCDDTGSSQNGDDDDHTISS